MTLVLLLTVSSAEAALIPGRYVSFWNSPWPNSCSVPPTDLPDWPRWRISTNANLSFLGETIATIYTAGRFPMFTGMGPGGECSDGDWNCTAATPVYGGIFRFSMGRLYGMGGLGANRARID